MMIQKPADRQTWEGEIASYWFLDIGILVSLSKNPKRTVENISGNVALVKSITGNKPSQWFVSQVTIYLLDHATKLIVF